MPKKRSYLFIAFFPYIIWIISGLFAFVYSLVSTTIIDPLLNNIFDPYGGIPTSISNLSEPLYFIGAVIFWGVPLIIYIIALINSFKLFKMGQTNKWESKELLRINMIIKLCHIPSYLLLFYTAIVVLLFGGPIIAFVSDCFIMLTSGIVGFAGLLRARKEEKLSTSLMLIFAVSQFLFCIDVPVTILLHFLFRNKPEKNIQELVPQYQQ